MKTGPQISNNYRSRRGGFSLAEVLIAMGIFGIGLALTASLFPTGASQTRASVDNVLGPMICQNALSIMKTRLSHQTCPYNTTILTYVSNIVPAKDIRFPTDDENTLLTFRSIGRRMKTNENDYQFVIVACRRANISNTVFFSAKSGTISDYQSTSRIVFTNSTNLQLGTPIIVREASATINPNDPLIGGEWAIVTAIDGATVTLDRRLPATSGNVGIYVIYESGANIYRSPAMSVLVARTPLPEQ